MNDEHALGHLLHKKLFSTGRSFELFKVTYTDDVDADGLDLEQAVESFEFRDDSGTMTVWRMPNEIAVAMFVGVAEGDEEPDEVWSCFKTKSYVERQEHFARWNAFARGHWTKDCPNEPGRYAVAPLSAGIPKETPFTMLTEYDFRRLQRIEGVVRDVTTHCPSPFRTEWRGYWWSEALPMMIAPNEA